MIIYYNENIKIKLTIYFKDVNEKKFIPKISTSELKALNLEDVVVERAVLEMMENAEHQKSIQVINGLKPGNLTKALNGEEVGTIIYADPKS
mgnify:CR=1 FL=1